jgi:hypothetical protein
MSECVVLALIAAGAAATVCGVALLILLKGAERGWWR